jgi:hypothetical protein
MGRKIPKIGYLMVLAYSEVKNGLCYPTLVFFKKSPDFFREFGRDLNEFREMFVHTLFTHRAAIEQPYVKNY